MAAYYNEHDAKAAAWLRELIRRGLIADGEVDERSIELVQPDDLRGFTQCHFFAGIGGWSYALRLAGWDDTRPVWTGSCPCQPFSSAGKRQGEKDERHLWPEFHRLIAECGPAVVLGEQVASKDGLAWLDTVFADLERSAYAAGAVDMCAAGVGAPHIRQRLWFVAQRLDDTAGARHERALAGPEGNPRHETRLRLPGAGSGFDRLGDASGAGLSHGEPQDLRGARRRIEGRATEQPGRSFVGMADADSNGRAEAGDCLAEAGSDGNVGDSAPGRLADAERLGWRADGKRDHGGHDGPQLVADGPDDRPGPVNGFWRSADWLHCRDERWRPVEPGTFPLAHGAAARVGRLRGYGNAINAEAARIFIEAADGAMREASE